MKKRKEEYLQPTFLHKMKQRMKSMKITWAALLFGTVFICMLIPFMLTSCAEEESIANTEEETEDKIQIGMCFDSFVIERWQRDRDVFVATAKELGADVNVQNANGVFEEQVEQIQYFIDKKVDVLVIVAIDSEKISKVVRDAKRAGIYVVAYDRLISDADVNLYISFDNEKVGSLMADALMEEVPEGGDILTLCGPTTDTNVGYVVSGFEKELPEKNIEIVGTMNADGWKAELAYNYLNDNFDLVNSIDGIMCGNDSMAGQAVRYLSERRLAGEIPVVGQDADLEACQRIVEGTQLMTVYKPVENLARTAAEYSVKLASGEKLDAKDLINDGSYNVPYVKLDPIAVTEENMDEVIIQSGFHLKEEVYLNVPEKMK